MILTNVHGSLVRFSPDETRVFLREQLTQTAEGNGRLVVVGGGIASGKTMLQHRILADAAETGALTLSATGAPDEQDIDGAVIEQLLANCPLPLDTPDPADGPESVRDVCQALLDVARTRTIVVAVDDVDYADDTSLRLLLRLQRRIRPTRMLMVLNTSSRPARGDQGLVPSLTRQPHCQVRLAPMSRDHVGELLRESLDGAVGTELPAQVHALTGGNPMLTDAVIEDYRYGDRTGEPTAGGAYARAVSAFLDRTEDPRLVEVAAAVAVLDTHSSPEHVCELTGIAPETVSTALDALAGGGLLTDGRFRHPSAADAVLALLPSPVRATLHASAVKLKYWCAAPATEVARHIVAAGEAAHGWCVPVLLRASEQAMAVDDLAFANRCLELALRSSTDERQRRSLRQSFVRGAWRLNPSAVVPHLAPLREAAGGDGLDLTDSFLLMRHALWNGDRQAFTEAHGVLAGASDHLDPQTEAELDLAHQWHFGAMPTTPPTPSPATDRAATGDSGGAAQTPWHETAATLVRVWHDGGGEATTASAELILRNCRLGDTALEALATAIVALVRGNRLDRADWWCAKLAREAHRHGAVTWQAMLEALRAGVTLRRGDVNAAAEQAQAALDMLGEHNWGVAIGYPLTVLLQAQTAARAFDDAARTVRTPVPEAMLRTVGGLHYLRACGHFYLATNRPLAAMSRFQRCQRMMRQWETSAPAVIPWRSDLAEANLRLGNVATARGFARAQLEQAGGTDPYAQGLALRVLALCGQPAERVPGLHRAAAAFKEAGHQPELTRTLVLIQRAANPAPSTSAASTASTASAASTGLARLVVAGPTPRCAATRPDGTTRQAGPGTPATPVPRGSAPQTSGQQTSRQQTSGQQASVPQAPVPRTPAPRGEPADSGDSGDSGDSTGESTVLSDAELRVAQLAALGRTNRQIAGGLFITVSTVEQHLTRAYRKLGVSGRRGLADELRPDEDAVPAHS